MRNKDIAAELDTGVCKPGAGVSAMPSQILAGIERDLPRGAPARKVDAARLAALTTQTVPVHPRKRRSGAGSVRIFVREALIDFSTATHAVPCIEQERAAAGKSISFYRINLKRPSKRTANYSSPVSSQGKHVPDQQ
ncbi:MAG: hypothetical protein ABS69_01220 [Nitrosomonadales bacterium SCN 54-20]|nr:MAG: hypothetical protein ABS69_01220 [Nitrosomonadales bacterium SCN 54-20]